MLNTVYKFHGGWMGDFTQNMWILHTVYTQCIHDLTQNVWPIYALLTQIQFCQKSRVLGVEYCNHTECLCKWNDKYEVCMTMTMTVLAVLEWRDSIFNVSHVWRDVPRASALTMWMWICGNSWQQCQVQSRWQHIQSYKCIFSKYFHEL